MAGAGADPAVKPRGQRGQAQLFGQGDGPDQVLRGSRDCQRAQPDADTQRIPQPVEADQRTRLGHRKPGSRVEGQHQRAQRDVGKDEPGAALAPGDIADQDRHGGDGEHGGEKRQPEGEIVGIEAIGVGHEALPGDEHRDEQPGEAKKSEERVIDDELMRELGDRHHEDHVEEELEPGCVAPLRFPGGGAKAGRPKPLAEAWASSFLGPWRAPNFDPHRRIR